MKWRLRDSCASLRVLWRSVSLHRNSFGPAVQHSSLESVWRACLLQCSLARLSRRRLALPRGMSSSAAAAAARMTNAGYSVTCERQLRRLSNELLVWRSSAIIIWTCVLSVPVVFLSNVSLARLRVSHDRQSAAGLWTVLCQSALFGLMALVLNLNATGSFACVFACVLACRAMRC